MPKEEKEGMNRKRNNNKHLSFCIVVVENKTKIIPKEEKEGKKRKRNL